VRRYVLLIALISFPIISFCQIQIIAGPGASYNSTWLLNPNMFIEGNQSPEPTFTIGTGLDTDIKLTRWLSFHTGLNSGEIKQDFIVEDENGLEFNSSHSLKTTNIPLVLRWGGAFYFESGFQYASVKSATWAFEGSNTDVSQDFRKNNWLATGGFGGNIGIAPKLKLNIGLRTAYGMRDFLGVDAWGKNYEDIAFFSELQASGQDLSEIEGAEEFIDENNQINSLITDFDNLAKTYSLSVGVYFGLKYQILGSKLIKKD